MTIAVTSSNGGRETRGHIVEGTRTMCGHPTERLTIMTTEQVDEAVAPRRIRGLGSTPCGKCWEVLARRQHFAKLRREGRL